MAEDSGSCCSMMEKIIIAAVADNLAIGKDNNLLWHISEDLKFFKKNTSGCCIIMGRRTFESLGRPLPNRLNIVISRKASACEGALLAASLQEAYDIAAARASEFGMQQDKCFVTGGGQIYSQAMESANKLIITRVHTTIDDADTFFPEICPETWKIDSRSSLMHDDQSGLDYESITYIRK